MRCPVEKRVTIKKLILAMRMYLYTFTFKIPFWNVVVQAAKVQWALDRREGKHDEPKCEFPVVGFRPMLACKN